MGTWVLILLVYGWSGFGGQTISMSVESVPGFTSEETCRAAGRAVANGFASTTPGKAATFVCAKQ